MSPYSALEFGHNSRFKTRDIAFRERDAIGPEVRLVGEADEVGDEAKSAGLSCLELAEDEVIGLDRVTDGDDVPDVAGLAEDGHVADKGDAIGRDLGEAGEDEIGEARDEAVVFRQAGLVVEN